MTHTPLNISVSAIIQAGHKLIKSVILYSADGRWLEEKKPAVKKREAWLFTLPEQYISARNLSELEYLYSLIRSTSDNKIVRPEGNSELCSGWAGYFSYGAGAVHHNLQSKGVLAEFAYYPAVVHLSPETEQATVRFRKDISKAEQQLWLDAFYRQLEGFASNDNTIPPQLSWIQCWQESDYKKKLQQVFNYLKAGDAYQVNLAMPFYTKENLRERCPLPLFKQMNPSFGGYINMPARTIFSASPERFIYFNKNNMTTRPIKGTSARDSSPQQDAINKEWLKNSKKNQAENLMIVDLLRNDMSVEAKPFSVKVTKLFEIESHENVHHMVSTITAELKDGVHPVDVMRKALPGGSITGAPKQRAMEIIEELEPDSRGAYCGCMGVFGDNRISDFNILIRSIEADDNGAECWAGGGITIDSDPEEELLELYTKIRKILNCPL